MGGEREKLYQPFVEAENVRRLYRLKLLTGRPMTRLINEAIEFYDLHLRKIPVTREVTQDYDRECGDGDNSWSV